MIRTGQIGMTLDISFPEPKTDSNDDKVASELALQFYVSALILSGIHSKNFFRELIWMF